MNDKNKKTIRWNIVFLLIAASSLVIRILMHYRFNTSALLYIGVPFCIALVLMWLVKPNTEGSWKRKFLNLTLISLIVMLGSSIVLFEGFVCVVMFMPIYFFVILVVFILKYLAERYRNRKGSQLFSHILPLIIILSGFEGTHPEFSVQRNNQVTVTRVINANIGEINRQLINPIQLQKDRPLFLKLFPMPYKVKGGTLQEGDIHEIHFRYHRWFVTNTHEGSMHMKIETVGERKIKTIFIKDTSYIANYLKLTNIEILLEPINNQTTRVIFSISYQRLLDPAWYFEPLQQYGIKKSIEFIITEVVTPNEK